MIHVATSPLFHRQELLPVSNLAQGGNIGLSITLVLALQLFGEGYVADELMLVHLFQRQCAFTLRTPQGIDGCHSHVVETLRIARSQIEDAGLAGMIEENTC